MAMWRKKVRKQQEFLRQSRRVRASRRMQLECLEDRLLLAVRVWDGDADMNWSNPVNWVGDVAPLAHDELVFAESAFNKTNVNDLADGTVFTTISFTGAGYSISGTSSIILTGGLTSNASGNNSFTVPIEMIGAQTFASANQGSTLTLGSIDTGSSFLLTANGDGDLNVEGVVSGSGGITKFGGGTLVLSGNNTYEGVTTITEGVVRIRHSNALGADTALTIVNAAAALEIDGSLGGVNVGAEVLQITGRGIDGVNDQFLSTGALRNIEGDNSWAGNVSIVTTALFGVDADTSLNISGVISSSTGGAANLVKVGEGTLEFSGTSTNTYSGTTTVNEGTLRLSKSGGAVAVTGNLIIGDHVGTDVVELGASEQIAHLDLSQTVNRTLVINGSGQLNLGNFDETVGAITFNRVFDAAGSVTSGLGTLFLEGNVTVSSTLHGSTGNSPAATISGNLDLGGRSRTFTVNDTRTIADAQISPDLVISADITGADADIHLIKAGVGYLSLSGNNTFAGNLFAAGGLGIGSNTAAGQGLLSLGNTTVIAEGGDRVIANEVSLDGTLIIAGTNNLTFAGAANLTGNRTVRSLQVGQVTEFAGGIGEQLGLRSLALGGLGTFVVSAPVTATGTLTIGANTVLGPTASVEELGVLVQGGNLVVSGQGTIREFGAITMNQDTSLTLDNSTVNLTDRLGDAAIGLNGARVELIGMAGTHSSEVTGAINSTIGHNQLIVTPGAGGTVELNPLSMTLSQGGTIEYGSNGADLGSDEAKIRFITTPTSVTNFTLNRAFVADSSGQGLATFDAALGIIAFENYVVNPPADFFGVPITATVRLTSGTYTLTSDTTIGSLFLDGDNITIDTDGFELRITSGTILDSGDDNVIGGSGTVTSAANSFNVTTFDASSTTTINAIISAAGTGGVTKSGNGTLVLGGNNGFTGLASVNEGVLRITHDSALGDATGSTVVRDGATLELDGVNVVGQSLTSLVGTGVNGFGHGTRAVGRK